MLTSVTVEARPAIIWQLLYCGMWLLVGLWILRRFRWTCCHHREGKNKTPWLSIHLPSPLYHWNEYPVLMLVIIADWFYVLGDDWKGFNCYRTVWVTFGTLSNTRTCSLSSVMLSLCWSSISIRMPSPSSVILPSHSAVFSLIQLCALDSSISLFNIPQNSSLVMQMPCSATQPTPVARTTKLRINKDIVQRTFGCVCDLYRTAIKVIKQ